MLLSTFIPDIAGRIERTLVDSSLRVLVAFDGDGTTFKQYRKGQAWDINPTVNIIKNLTAIARKGHYELLTSARQCEEITKSSFSAVPNIGFQSNDDTATNVKGKRFDSIPLPNWSIVYTAMKKELSGILEIRNIPMEHFYSCQMWNSHKCYKEAEDLLSSLILLIDDQSCHNFQAIAMPEGHYFMPVETPGKRKGYFAFAERLSHKIGLYITCENGENDKDMLTAVGNLKNGIAF